MSETSKEINISGVTIVLSQNVNEVKNLAEHGYTPVECSFGLTNTIVDKYEMDHHGLEYSHKPGVSINAIENYYGVKKDDPKFVANHIDADNTFAIAAMAGLILDTEDMRKLAKTIADMDIDPIRDANKILEMPMIDRVFLFEQMTDGMKWTSENMKKAIQTMIEICDLPKGDRVAAAKDDMKNGGQKMGAVYTINKPKTWGFDIWYERQEDKGSSTSAKGWKNPIVMILSEEENITFGAPKDAVAEEVFGSEIIEDKNGEKVKISGITRLCKKLNEVYGCPPESGFGGHPSIGGSPRGQKMTEEDLKKCAMVINEMIVAHHSEKAKSEKAKSEKAKANPFQQGNNNLVR
jgi:hypothetical protein